MVHAIVSFGLIILLTAVLWLGVKLDPLLSWLVSITLITFLAFGYDKGMSKAGHGRIPEKVLLTLTFAGGTIGALLGRYLFNHKITKTSFRAKFWAVVIVQIIIVGAYFYLKLR